jgi:hypothetical protein
MLLARRAGICRRTAELWDDNGIKTGSSAGSKIAKQENSRRKVNGSRMPYEGMASLYP